MVLVRKVLSVKKILAEISSVTLSSVGNILFLNKNAAFPVFDQTFSLCRWLFSESVIPSILFENLPYDIHGIVNLDPKKLKL